MNDDQIKTINNPNRMGRDVTGPYNIITSPTQTTEQNPALPAAKTFEISNPDQSRPQSTTNSELNENGNEQVPIIYPPKQATEQANAPTNVQQIQENQLQQIAPATTQPLPQPEIPKINIQTTANNPHDIIKRTEDHLATTDRYGGDISKVLYETINQYNSQTSQ